MLRRALPALLFVVISAAAVSFPAWSRVVSVSTGSTTRISKPPRKPLTMFYAAYLSQKEVQLYPYPGHLEIGQRYDLLDDRGWVGTVEVTSVNAQDNGCGGTYDLGVGEFVGNPRWGNYGSIWAVGPGAHATSRAKQLGYNEVQSSPPGNRMAMQFVDLDGDKNPEVARITTYDCEILSNGTIQQTPGNGVTCYVIWSRSNDGEGWKVSERGEAEPCY
jgi:hypothetical protein